MPSPSPPGSKLKITATDSDVFYFMFWLSCRKKRNEQDNISRQSPRWWRNIQDDIFKLHCLCLSVILLIPLFIICCLGSHFYRFQQGRLICTVLRKCPCPCPCPCQLHLIPCTIIPIIPMTWTIWWCTWAFFGAKMWLFCFRDGPVTVLGCTYWQQFLCFLWLLWLKSCQFLHHLSPADLGALWLPVWFIQVLMLFEWLLLTWSCSPSWPSTLVFL